MLEIKELVADRRTDIDSILQLLSHDDISIHNNISIKGGSALKATIFVMLYNLIEGVIMQSFEKIFDLISNNVSDFSVLNDKLQQLYIKPYTKRLNDTNKIVEFIGKTSILHKLTFEQYSNENELFSGNLDAMKIRTLLKMLGVQYEYHSKNEHKLCEIKNYRNQLAHGEKSYSELGRNYTIRDLIKYRDATFDYINGYINIIEKYLNEGGYLQSNMGCITYG